MGLNKSKGQMYPWVDYTWNPIRGRCPHDCSYCYMRGFRVGELRLVPGELEADLGQGNKIFVGSSTDMWAEAVPLDWIHQVLQICRNFDNTYLFQTKNPYKFRHIDKWNLPPKTMWGVTIETNRDYIVSKAPPPSERAEYFAQVDYVPTMVSIEPIMDFDLEEMLHLIAGIKPDFVSIGADSKGHNLPEPDGDKLEALINRLGTFTEIRQKANLARLKS